MTIFWDTVKEEIKDQNVTQEWVAWKSGIKFNTLHGWISKNVLPRAQDAVRIAQALNTTVEYLVTGKMKQPCSITDSIEVHVKRIQEELSAIISTAKGYDKVYPAPPPRTTGRRPTIPNSTPNNTNKNY